MLRTETESCPNISIGLMDCKKLATIVTHKDENVLLIDGRSFLEYNLFHIRGAVNLSCSKIMKRRVQQNKISINELLLNTCGIDLKRCPNVIIYDQESLEYECLPEDSFISVLLSKLKLVVNSVNIVIGGFLEFQLNFPELCERKTRRSCPSLPSLPQPCLTTSDSGPTRILPFLYLGSQHDALNCELLRSHNITYELNVSTTCPKPDFIKDSHFMRIPVNDNYSEKLLPHFPKACNFLDKVKESNGCAIVHCLAGISRSATIAIAYVMRHMKMSSDEAYRYVKSKRDSISPNFNFIGELLEFERQLRGDRILESRPNESCTTSPSSYTSPAVLQQCQ